MRNRRGVRAPRQLQLALAVVVISAVTGAHAGYATGVPVTAASLSTFRPTELPPACVGTATTTLTASADSWIDQAAAGSNYGTDATLNVAAMNGAVRRVLVSFTIGTGCTPTSATLRLYNGVATGGRTIHVYRAGGSWSESGVTWTNQPALDGTAVAAASTAAWMEWDVTTHVQTMLSSGNYGFVIRDMDEGGILKHQEFASRETPNKPQLVLQW